MEKQKLNLNFEEKDHILDYKIQNILETFKEEEKNSNHGMIDKIVLSSNSSEYCCMIITNLFFFLFFLPIIFGFFTTHPNEVVVIETMGKPIKIINEPGCHWYFPCLNSFRKVSKKLSTIQLTGSSVPDLLGSPLEISVVITYSIQDALSALYNVQSAESYLHSQALEVVRRVISKFKYRSNDEKEVTLIKDSMVLGKYMKELLNIKMQLAGIVVTRMELMEISYHPGIAQGMLQIQQASAKVEARKEIVKGGVEIVRDALDQLKEKKIILSDKNQEDLIKNLMIVVCSDVGRPQAVFDVNG